MKSFVACAALTIVVASATSPVSKVLDLLTSLEAKISAEGEEAKKMYEELSDWCKDGSKNLEFEIKTGKSQVEDLTATIEQQTATQSALSSKIDELGASLTTDSADLKSATEIRTKEAADFAAEDKELVEVIDTLQRAIGLLEREMSKSGASALQWSQASNMTQALAAMVQASVLSSADATRLTSLVQSQSSQEADDASEDSLGAPAAAVYEGHSGGIIETLQDLLEKAQDQLAEARKAEASSQHNFNMVKQSLEDSIKFGNKDMASAKTDLASTGEKKAAAEGDVAVTSKGVQEDTKSLAELKESCMTKSEDYEAATKSRAEELKALAEAKKSIEESTAGASSLTYGLDQVSFIQIAAANLRSSEDLSNFEAVRFVRDLARKQHSQALTQLASRMAAAMRSSTRVGEDPFAKVKAMISGMIDKLMSEASAEASHKSYCDKETSESLTKETEVETQLDKVNTKIDSLSARSAQLKEQVATLQSELAELASSQAEITKIRQEEKTAYAKNKADMEQGLEGVKTALTILREYYATEDKAHDSADGAATSIVGMLEVVESDFSKGLAEMVATESSSESSYDKQSKENSILKTTKDQDVKYKSKESADLDKSVAELKSDRSGLEAQLDAVKEYIKKLDPMCVAKAEPYEERVRRREAEIAGLKEAISILEGSAALVQGARSHFRTRGALRGATVSKHLQAK